MPAFSKSLRAEVIEIGAGWVRAQRRLVALVTRLDESGEWALDGARTCAHWVAAALDVEVSTAWEWLRVGHALKALPHTQAAFNRAEASYSAVRALTRVAAPDNEAELLAVAMQVPAGRVAAAIAGWLCRHEPPARTEERQRSARYLTWRLEPDGMLSGTFRFEPLEGARVTAPIEAAVARRGRTQRAAGASADASAAPSVRTWPTLAQQRADALVDIISNGAGQTVTEIVVHVRGDGATLDDGTPIAGSIVERIAPVPSSER